MTAPAAMLIQRPTPTLGAPQPERQVGTAAQESSAIGGFAAHLESKTPPAAPAEAGSPLAHAATVPGKSRTTLPDAAFQAEPEGTAATGKGLPDKRQALAETATQTVLAMLGVKIGTGAGTEGGTEPAEASVDAPTLDPSTPAPATPEALQLPGAVAALALPVPTAPTATTAPPRGPASAQNGPYQNVTTARPGAAPKRQDAPSVSAKAPTAATPNAALVAPAVSLVLEHDAAAQDAPKPASGEVQQTTTQAAAHAEPSTFAALTGASDTARAPGRKPRADAETALPASKTAFEPTASVLPQPQPFAAIASADPTVPASAQPAEGIGFDALVDSIARARDGAPNGIGDGSPVAVAMRHAEFGRVSLRFQTDANGLSVAMASADPAFAPAVAAAHAAEAAAAAAMTSDAAQRPVQPSAASSDTGSNSEMQSGGERSTGQNTSGQNNTSQRQEADGQARFAGNAPRGIQRGGEAPAAETAGNGSGGIFA